MVQKARKDQEVREAARKGSDFILQQHVFKLIGNNLKRLDICRLTLWRNLWEDCQGGLFGVKLTRADAKFCYKPNCSVNYGIIFLKSTGIQECTNVIGNI